MSNSINTKRQVWITRLAWFAGLYAAGAGVAMAVAYALRTVLFQ